MYLQASGNNFFNSRRMPREPQLTTFSDGEDVAGRPISVRRLLQMSHQNHANTPGRFYGNRVFVPLDVRELYGVPPALTPKSRVLRPNVFRILQSLQNSLKYPFPHLVRKWVKAPGAYP